MYKNLSTRALYPIPHGSASTGENPKEISVLSMTVQQNIIYLHLFPPVAKAGTEGLIGKRKAFKILFLILKIAKFLLYWNNRQQMLVLCCILFLLYTKMVSV